LDCAFSIRYYLGFLGLGQDCDWWLRGIPQDFRVYAPHDRFIAQSTVFLNSMRKKVISLHEKLYNGDIERLRTPERVARLEVERVVALCLDATDLKSVLEVGIGSGLFAEAFVQHGLEVAGVDVNPQMIVAARRFVPKGDFREATAEVLPYPDDSFDLVFFGLVLHESDEQLKVLQEARRVSRHRIRILEWPYQEGEFGPPLAHRLKPTEIADMVKMIDFTHLENIPLTHLVLYRLTV